MQPDAVGELADADLDLRGANPPAELSGEDQQAEIDQPEQQYRVRNVMFEQADHGVARLPPAR